MSLAGRLLVATPLIADPGFERTVVLLLAHGPQGAFGLVLNRPSDTTVDEVAPAWSDTAAAPGVVFVGGPVGRDSVVALGRTTAPDPEGADLIVGDCAPVNLNRPPGDGEAEWSGVRLFAGSAGWAAGQLEDELDEGAWWTVAAEAGDIVATDPERQWSEVLRRQRGEVAWFANHPDDPTSN
ncbi:YqgE/AlgH family protein [Aquihabitans sp. McL0605]|uniref:YqgE/AlgH family protein n=1 Tax=Aquihabitans sp. McL0605 TaxID=3415671 RepID=UPI003CF65CCF